MSSITEQEHRGEYVAGLRALADLLDTQPDVPVPTYGSNASQPIVFVATLGTLSEQKDEAARIVRGVGGLWAKAEAGTSGTLFKFSGKIRGLHLEVLTHRDAVCRRVVTGTREVTKTVPAPDAPMIEVTETVEDVEWVCGPLLAEHTTKAIDRILTTAETSA